MFATTFGQLADNVERAVLGKRHVIELVLTAMLSDGHVLLEDVPGTGKTRWRGPWRSRSRARTRASSSRPTSCPATSRASRSTTRRPAPSSSTPAPVFANIVLADEINRASPKTQSALLEVMEEGKVTIDGVSRPVGVPFLVIATQNPIEQAGTYRLPEAQLDRFLMKTSLGYPDHAATVRILDGAAVPTGELGPVVSPQAMVDMADAAREVYVNALVLDYIARLVDATRSADEVRLGVSIRGALALTRVREDPRHLARPHVRDPGRREGARGAGALAPADPASRSRVRRRDPRGDHRAGAARRALRPSQREAV